MDTTQHTHAAIISLTQYEAAVYANDLDAARAHLLDTMRHIVAISKQTPAAPDYRPPPDLGRPDRACRYLRCMNYLTSILPIIGWEGQPHNHVAGAWFECCALCEFHGWMPPATMELAQPVPVLVAARPLLPRR